MILPNGWSIARVRSQGLGSRHNLFTSPTNDRAAAFYALLASKSDSRLLPSFAASNVRRNYADKPVSRPKAHTGRTTTARRAPTTSATKAAKKPVKTSTAPKAIPKAKSKAKPKARSKAKPRKKPKAKAKPKPKRKVLSEKQKTARATKEKREKIKSLKAKALLHSPKKTPSSAWSVYNAERMKATTIGKGGAALGDVAKQSSAGYRAITPEQLEHYNHLANQNKAANNAAQHNWVESHTPQQIHEANMARLTLKRLVGKKGSQKYNPIKDDRQVKGPLSAYILFYKERYATGDFKGLKAPEAVKLASREWKALSATEKKPYENKAAEDQERYSQEFKTVYNQ